MLIDFNFDSFSHGQVKSKLWLCETLETHFTETIEHALILGGWYGILPFLLFSRNQLRLRSLTLLELDENSLEISRKILDFWKVQGFPLQFVKGDAMTLDHSSPAFSNVDLVINTSCEHMAGTDWYERIRAGTRVALQGTNMRHPEHIFPFESLAIFQNQFLNLEALYAGEIHFSYPTQSFDRFMLIGRKF